MIRALGLFLCLSALAFGQGSVTIYGTVKDGTGALVPGTTVSITHVETGTVRQAVSNERGDYIASQLAIGGYTVTAEKPGFKKFVQTGIAVQVDENRMVPITLQVGDVAESVTVEAQAVQVDTRTGTLKEVVDSKRIVELPLNGRNPLQLQLLVPGAGAVAGAGQGQNSTISINGGRQNGNNYVCWTAAITMTRTSIRRACFRRPTRWRNFPSRPIPIPPNSDATPAR